MNLRILLWLLAVAFLPQPRWADAATPPPVGAEHGMVVSAHRLASEIGVGVLAHGGNAVDAAIATAYALAVTFPEAGNLGGGGFLLVRMADGRSSFIDFREAAPGAARRDMYLDDAGVPVPLRSTRGHLSAGVPGTVAGLELAREKYGTTSRGSLLAPAVRLAEQGFVLDAADADFLAQGADDFRRDAPSRAIFLHGDRPYAAGERLVQTDLAKTLRVVAQSGAAGFYQGEPARRIAASSQAGGGILKVEDFARYRAVERAPVECDYRGYHILSASPPSSGGVVVCETLQLLSGWPADADGFHSADSVHRFVESLRRAFHDRNLELGDPDFVPVDVAQLLSPARIDQLRLGIDLRVATPSSSLGGVPDTHEGRNTTHLSVVDRQGNAASLTFTLNDWFGARVTASGTGVLLNDEMDDFSAKPGFPNLYGLVEGSNNAIEPGKRPLSSMAPTILTQDGRLRLVVGTPGGSHIPTGVLQTIINLIDYDMTLNDAVYAPRIHAQWLPDVVYYEKGALSRDTRSALAERGHRLEPMNYWNQVAAILVGAPALRAEPRGRDRLFGVIDPRLPVGSAAGY